MKLTVDERIDNYAKAHSSREPELLSRLERSTHERMKNPQMLTGRLEGRLLKLITQLVEPELVVELGTFTGYSALSIAEGLPPGGRIVTCEVDPDARAMAQQAFDESPFGDRIEIRIGPALDTLATIDGPIDLSFIDADKLQYPAYYEALLCKTRPGGVLMLDNMLWSGRVLSPDPDDAETLALAGLNRTVAEDPRVDNVLLTVRDGIQLVRKR